MLLKKIICLLLFAATLTFSTNSGSAPILLTRRFTASLTKRVGQEIAQAISSKEAFQGAFNSFMQNSGIVVAMGVNSTLFKSGNGSLQIETATATRTFLIPYGFEGIGEINTSLTYEEVLGKALEAFDEITSIMHEHIQNAPEEVFMTMELIDTILRIPELPLKRYESEQFPYDFNLLESAMLTIRFVRDILTSREELTSQAKAFYLQGLKIGSDKESKVIVTKIDNIKRFLELFTWKIYKLLIEGKLKGPNKYGKNHKNLVGDIFTILMILGPANQTSVDIAMSNHQKFLLGDTNAVQAVNMAMAAHRSSMK